jgi:hypothetical protein
MGAGEHDGVGPRRVLDEAGASSAAIAASSTGLPRSSVSASVASRAEPTSVTSQPAANSRIRARVYSRCTVASVPSTDTRLVRDAAQAGLIAGTVPTNGTAKRARKLGSTMVEAVLQARTTRSGSCASTTCSIRSMTRATSCAGSMAP